MIIGIRSVRYFVLFALRTLWRIITLKPVFAPEYIQFHRRAVCFKCPRLVGMQCEICTCFVELKTQFTAEICPDWPPRWT